MSDEYQVSSGNVFEDLGFSETESESLRIRSQLMAQITELIRLRGLKQTEAAKLMGVTQPRISDLVRGKIGKFSSDMLIEMLARSGMKVELSISEDPLAA